MCVCVCVFGCGVVRVAVSCELVLSQGGVKHKRARDCHVCMGNWPIKARRDDDDDKGSKGRAARQCKIGDAYAHPCYRRASANTTMDTARMQKRDILAYTSWR